MVIKVLFVLLIVCTTALIAVGFAVLLRVRRHMKQEQMDSQIRSTIGEAAEKTKATNEDRSP